MNSRTILLRLVVLISVWAGALPGADRIVLEQNYNGARVTATDATVTPLAGRDTFGLRIATAHAQPWPGVGLPAPGGSWDLSPYERVMARVKNLGTNRVTVYCRVDNAGADGIRNCVTGSLGLNAGQEGLVRVELSRGGDDTLGGKLFGMRGYPVGPGGKGGSFDPARVTQLLVFVSKPIENHLFEVDEVRATGTYTPPTASVTDATSFFPFIDTFGQYRHKDWPGKVHSLAELMERRQQEAEELAEKPGPKDWDKYGGWADGPQLRSTGFFRTEKHNGKWWLVDPEGRLFFSHGIDCVRMLDRTPTEERESGSRRIRAPGTSSRRSWARATPSTAITRDARRRASPSPAPTCSGNTGGTGSRPMGRWSTSGCGAGA